MHTYTCTLRGVLKHAARNTQPQGMPEQGLWMGAPPIFDWCDWRQLLLAVLALQVQDYTKANLDSASEYCACMHRQS
jgi:hypothetical protein